MTLKPHNRFRFGIFLPALVMSSICASAQPVQGTISGIVFGPNGKSLGGTSVWANLISPAPRPVDRNSGVPVLSAITGGDGSFTISHVPPGDYILGNKSLDSHRLQCYT